MKGSTPNKDRAHDVDAVLLQDDATVDINVRIGLVDGQPRVIIAEVRAEQQQLQSVQQEFETREKTRIGMEQTIGSARRGANIAMTVKNDKSIAVLERTARPRRRSGRSNVERDLGIFLAAQIYGRGQGIGWHDTSISSCMTPVQSALHR